VLVVGAGGGSVGKTGDGPEGRGDSVRRGEVGMKVRGAGVVTWGMETTVRGAVEETEISEISEVE